MDQSSVCKYSCTGFTGEDCLAVWPSGKASASIPARLGSLF